MAVLLVVGWQGPVELGYVTKLRGKPLNPA
jgi:hypothetical protein